MPHYPRPLGAVVLVLWGCHLPDFLGLGRPQIVVQGILSSVTNQQILWIEESLDPASSPTRTFRPVTPAPSAVLLQDSAGSTVASFMPDSAFPAKYLAGFSPIPGRAYRLVIVVAGDTVRAATVVPSIALLAPSTDTVALSAADTLRLRWTSATASATAVLVLPSDAAADTTPIRGDQFERDSAFSANTQALTPQGVVWVVAADPITVAAFSRTTDDRFLQGNVIGAAGFWGAVAVDKVYVIVN